MDSLGEFIRRERERKGITVEEASKVTRIRKTYLLAIEEGNLEIQSPVFMRGFLKSYADFLGLDSNDILEKYRLLLDEKENKARTEESKAEPVGNYSRYAVPAIAILSLLTLIITVVKMSTNKPATETAPQTLEQAIEAEAQQPATILTNRTTTQAMASTQTFQAVTAPKAPVTPPVPPEKPQKHYTLVIAAKEIAWLRIAIDDRNPVEVLLKAGETLTLTADQKFAIVAGNAGGIDLTLNGKPLESLGPSGKVVSKILPE